MKLGLSGLHASRLLSRRLTILPPTTERCSLLHFFNHANSLSSSSLVSKTLVYSARNCLRAVAARAERREEAMAALGAAIA